jgi:hypothetical protein
MRLTRTENENIITSTTRGDPARWPTSDRKHGRLYLGTGGRLQIGMPGRLRRNPHSAILSFLAGGQNCGSLVLICQPSIRTSNKKTRKPIATISQPIHFSSGRAKAIPVPIMPSAAPAEPDEVSTRIKKPICSGESSQTRQNIQLVALAPHYRADQLSRCGLRVINPRRHLRRES